VTPGKSDDITCSEVESSGVTGSLRQAECPFNWPLSSMLNGVVTERPGAARAAVMLSRSPRDRRGPGGTGPQRPVVSDWLPQTRTSASIARVAGSSTPFRGLHAKLRARGPSVASGQIVRARGSRLSTAR